MKIEWPNERSRKKNTSNHSHWKHLRLIMCSVWFRKDFSSFVSGWAYSIQFFSSLWKNSKWTSSFPPDIAKRRMINPQMKVFKVSISYFLLTRHRRKNYEILKSNFPFDAPSTSMWAWFDEIASVEMNMNNVYIETKRKEASGSLSTSNFEAYLKGNPFK